jgi:hypothetical protein
MANVKFIFRKKLDGSFDSICMRCSATVANSNTEKGLERAEMSHTCEEETWLTRRSPQAMRKWLN